MSYIQQLLKGLIDPIILSMLNQLPMYGYQIGKELKQRSNGILKLQGGTIYPALLRLEKKGLVNSRWHEISNKKPRKYYHITSKGKKLLTSRSSDWHDFYNMVNRFMQGNPGLPEPGID